ncbi:unnamed protein product [Didymodactylos carnosus]|uniref:Uncharacterized protein n=1 Tax=Didymodactylos carnosus TaxID=1234261 RepID=A0A815CNC8_9BILA|nr:unnamed protein product [Didymodactylos carnosus]CAF1287485.1 unnamed protein product [Didymodactylos carnosus]CAF3935140.1 unnamed protein product [Didymodactylos carnosus]CAF4090032.1 unnamed protein product [Didymodactylos carnosus]
MGGGRAASTRRFSQYGGMHTIGAGWPVFESNELNHGVSRRRALDLYGTRQVLQSHEQMKRRPLPIIQLDSQIEDHGLLAPEDY